jgi:hypothetical protein
VRKLILAVLLSVVGARAHALTGCTPTSGAFQLQKVRTDATLAQQVGCINFSLDALSSGSPTNSTYTIHTAQWLQVQRISGISTGTPNVWLSSPTIVSIASAPFDTSFVFISSGSLLVQSTTTTAAHPVFRVRKYNGGDLLTIKQNGDFSIGGSTFTAAGGTVTIPQQLTVGSILMSGATSWITTGSSVTASAFFGNGSALTGIAGSISGGVSGRVPVYSGASTLSPSSFMTEVSSGVAISTHVTLGVAGASITVVGVPNFDIMIASMDVFNVYNATFDATWAILESSTPYILRISLANRSGGSAGFFLHVSTDAIGRACDYGQRYNTFSYGWNSSAGGSGSIGTSYFAFPIWYDGAQTNLIPDGGRTRSRDIEIETVEGSSHTWRVDAHGSSDYSTAGIQWNMLGQYSANGQIKALCITGSANYFTTAVTRNKKFDAHLELWRGPAHQ